MDIELSRLFVKVIQQGSFTKAATVLKVPKSTISKAVRRLEDETGTKLLLRTTRSLSLTSAGRLFFEACVGPLQLIEDAQKSLYGHDSLLSGTMKITAPEDLGNHIIAPAIGELVRKYPQLNFNINYTDEIVDLVKDGYDLAVRIGHPRDSSLKAKRAGEVTLILVAAPSYLRQEARVSHPRDLLKLSCLTITSGTTKWSLRTDSGTVSIAIAPRIVSNQMTSLMAMSIAGAGIALVPSYLCEKEIKKGRLVQVLPSWTSLGLPVTILSPISASSSARLKTVTEFIFEALKTRLSQS